VPTVSSNSKRRHGNKEIDPMDLTTRLIIAMGLGALLIGAFILI
jgi:hypothetical protein